jgi:hypothetical protein
MTSESTGGVIAARTTSLPEDIGGVRNWDYRYCWLRDSTLALEALLGAGYTDEALAFRDFLLRAGTGHPAKLQIMYGIAGERRLTEFELDELPGYERAKPVRIGNAASEQFQLDVYGDVVSVAFLGTEVLGQVTCGSCSAGEHWWSMSRRSGTSPITASGRRADRGVWAGIVSATKGSMSFCGLLGLQVDPLEKGRDDAGTHPDAVVRHRGRAGR